jgi:hypothetical protein
MLRRVLLPAATAACVASFAGVGAQVPTESGPPAAIADRFLHSVRALRWDAASELIHPETLARFSTLVSTIAAADATGETGRSLTGTDPDGFAALTQEQIFARAIASMLTDMPGLANALHDRDDFVLGHVMEGADSAHAVYRTLARIGGAVAEVKVIQLVRTDSGWRILWSDELEVLDAALRGVSTNRGPRLG